MMLTNELATKVIAAVMLGAVASLVGRGALRLVRGFQWRLERWIARVARDTFAEIDMDRELEAQRSKKRRGRHAR